MKELTGNQVTLLGNIPPRDVLAAGTPEQIGRAVKDTLNTLRKPHGQQVAHPTETRIILSAGGGMPPDVSTENINAFLAAASS